MNLNEFKVEDLVNSGLLTVEMAMDYMNKAMLNKIQEVFKMEGGVEFKKPCLLKQGLFKINIPVALQSKYNLPSMIRKKNLDDIYEILYLSFTRNKINATLNEVYAEWIEHAYYKQNRRGRTAHTIDLHKRAYMRCVFNSLLGNKIISKIEYDDFEDFWDGLNGKITNSLKNELKTVFNKLFRYAVKNKYCTINIAREYELDDFDVICTRTKRAKTPAERELLINHFLKLDSVYGYACALLECMNVRVGELKAFKWSDIDLDEGVIEISHEVNNDNEYVYHTKSKKSEGNHFLELSDRAIEILKLIKSKEYNFADNFVFMGKNNNFLLTQNINDNISNACELLGINKNFTSHDCRRYAATQAALKGMTGVAMQSAFGWADKNTAEHYINVAAAQKEHKEILKEVLN